MYTETIDGFTKLAERKIAALRASPGGFWSSFTKWQARQLIVLPANGPGRSSKTLGAASSAGSLDAIAAFTSPWQRR